MGKTRRLEHHNLASERPTDRSSNAQNCHFQVGRSHSHCLGATRTTGQLSLISFATWKGAWGRERRVSIQQGPLATRTRAIKGSRGPKLLTPSSSFSLPAGFMLLYATAGRIQEQRRRGAAGAGCLRLLPGECDFHTVCGGDLEVLQSCHCLRGLEVVLKFYERDARLAGHQTRLLVASILLEQHVQH